MRGAERNRFRLGGLGCAFLASAIPAHAQAAANATVLPRALDGTTLLLLAAGVLLVLLRGMPTLYSQFGPGSDRYYDLRTFWLSPVLALVVMAYRGFDSSPADAPSYWASPAYASLALAARDLLGPAFQAVWFALGAASLWLLQILGAWAVHLFAGDPRPAWVARPLLILFWLFIPWPEDVLRLLLLQNALLLVVVIAFLPLAHPGRATAPFASVPAFLAALALSPTVFGAAAIPLALWLAVGPARFERWRSPYLWLALFSLLVPGWPLWRGASPLSGPPDLSRLFRPELLIPVVSVALLVVSLPWLLGRSCYRRTLGLYALTLLPAFAGALYLAACGYHEAAFVLWPPLLLALPLGLHARRETSRRQIAEPREGTLA